ncbi:MAG: TetR-like C-terminal domain-containing protein, partial [Edaphobacter sp.]
LRYQPAANRKEMKDKIWPHLMAYSARNRAFGDAWRAKVLEPARVGLTASIKRGEKLGVLRSGIDPEIGIALLLGPMMYRRIFAQRLGRNAPKDLEVHVVDAFLDAFAKGKKAPGPRHSSKKR